MTSAHGSGVLRRARPSASGFSSCCGGLVRHVSVTVPGSSRGGRRSPCRIAERTRSPKSASPREANRLNSEAASTGVGTPSSTAACTVQRPSPESLTWPAYSSSSGRLVQRLRGQVEQPRGDHRAAPPELGDGGDVEVVLVEVGVAQRRRLGVGLLRVQADVRVLEDVEALGVRLHQPVLDAVVDHLHEVARARRAAVQPALLLGRRVARAAGRADGGVDSRRERLQHRREPADGLVVAADHQAVAALACPRRRR